MATRLRSALIAASTIIALVACNDSEVPDNNLAPTRAVITAGTHRQYGVPQKIGNGTARTYIVLDEKDNRTPLEIGVALSEDAMEGLPAAAPMPEGEHGNHKGHVMSNLLMLELPAQNPTSYKFVQFNWNPAGHEPDSVYTYPHFDFHFYRVTTDVVRSIVPSDPQWMAKAANLPPQAQWTPFYIDAGTAVGAPQGLVTFPLMGLHWVDVRSPELQKLAGRPELYQQFTKTFFIGSWNGEFIFEEPMITREYLLAKRAATNPAVQDEVIALPTAATYAPAGFYPKAYRITFDAQAKEYRVALTQLTRFE